MRYQYKLERPIEDYRPTYSKKVFSAAEARAEYNRLRSIANKRLERLKASEYADSSMGSRSVFAAPPKGATSTEIRKVLYDVAKFVNAKTSTVSGQKDALQKFVETMNDEEHGYYFINSQNARDFGKFMEKARRHSKERRAPQIYEAIALFEEAVRKRADMNSVLKAFDYYLEDVSRVPDETERRKKEVEAEKNRAKISKKLKERAEEYERKRRIDRRGAKRRGRRRR